MKTAASIFTGLVAFIHAYILVLESFLWTTAYGMKTFNLTPERAELTAVMAQNQGAYNGFLAAGLIWSFFIADAVWKRNVRLFFLGGVFVMGIVGAATAMVKILFIQSVPALIAMALVYFASKSSKS
jgi:putative membrane protein